MERKLLMKNGMEARVERGLAKHYCLVRTRWNVPVCSAPRVMDCFPVVGGGCCLLSSACAALLVFMVISHSEWTAAGSAILAHCIWSNSSDSSNSPSWVTCVLHRYIPAKWVLDKKPNRQHPVNHHSPSAYYAVTLPPNRDDASILSYPCLSQHLLGGALF